MRWALTTFVLVMLQGCVDGDGGRLPLPGPKGTQAAQGSHDGESGRLPSGTDKPMCDSTEKDVCGEFSEAAIAKCIELKGGEEACHSSRWERSFYTYIVSKLPAEARPLHCFADGKARPSEICGPFSDALVAACQKEGGGSPCWGNRWNKEFHASLAQGGGASAVTMTSAAFIFPTKRKSTPTCEDAGEGVGAFGAWRDDGTRKHAGCDLYGSHGDPLYAIQDGTVLAAPYEFYCDTDALEVRHGRKVIRYGEIKPGSATSSETVKAGEQVARVGLLSCYSQPMLHFEMYAGSATGPLSTSGNIYHRRSDLENPTTSLKAWKEALP